MAARRNGARLAARGIAVRGGGCASRHDLDGLGHERQQPRSPRLDDDAGDIAAANCRVSRPILSGTIQPTLRFASAAARCGGGGAASTVRRGPAASQRPVGAPAGAAVAARATGAALCPAGLRRGGAQAGAHCAGGVRADDLPDRLPDLGHAPGSRSRPVDARRGIARPGRRIAPARNSVRGDCRSVEHFRFRGAVQLVSRGGEQHSRFASRRSARSDGAAVQHTCPAVA